jgi:hypothetical protein
LEVTRKKVAMETSQIMSNIFSRPILAMRPRGCPALSPHFAHAPFVDVPLGGMQASYEDRHCIHQY